MADDFTTLDDLSSNEVVSQSQALQQEQVNKPPKPKSWLEDKRLAYIILVVGMAIIVIVFYFLFHSVGVI